MKVFVNYTLTNEILTYEIKTGLTVKNLIDKIKNHFDLGSEQVGESEQRLILVYSGGELHDDWVLSDLKIVPGSTIKCIFKEEKIPDYYVHIKFQKSILRFYEHDWNLLTFTVFKLRLRLSEEIGLPLTTFRLKSFNKDVELFDDKCLIDYGIQRHDHVLLETWQGWDSFLNYSIKGYTKQVIKTMSNDELIRQYQAKVALYISAHYGHIDLANTLISMGARPDRPVGEHPCRQWCLPIKIKPEYLRCPIHEAIINGQLKMVSLLYNLGSWILEEKDGFGLPPWRLALRNYHRDPVKNFKQKEVARFILSKQFGAKVKLTEKCSVSTLFYYNLRRWIERARERVLTIRGIGKSTMKKRPFHRGGLVGYKTLIDGYNNKFKDQIHCFDALRQKYKYFYYYSEEDKNRFKNPEIYFRTLNTVNAFNLLKPVAKFNKLIDSSYLNSNKQARKQNLTQPTIEITKPSLPLSKARESWKRIINKQISRNIITRYADVLRNMGYEVEIDQDYEELIKKNSTRSKSSSNNKQERSNFLKSVKMQLAREEGELMSIKHENQKSKNRFLKPIESKDTKGLQRSYKYLDTSMSVIIPSKESNDEVLHFNPLKHLSNVVNSDTNQNNVTKSNGKYESPIKSRSVEFESNAMNEYLKYCDYTTPKTNALKCLRDANEFKTKPWLKQLSIGTTMIRQKFKRNIDLKL